MMTSQTVSRSRPSIPALAAPASLLTLLVVVAAGCDGGRASDPPETKRAGQVGDPSAAASTPPSPAGGDVPAPVAGEQRASCSPGRARRWTLEDPTTVPGAVSRARYEWPTELVVVREGTATVAYSAPGHVTRTADDPPAQADPQDPAGDTPEAVAFDGDTLAVDAASNQTLAYLDLQHHNSAGVEVADLVLIDRPPHGTWSTNPTRLEERVVDRVDLAVNAAGSAVVIWSDHTGNDGARLRAMYRPSAGAAWSKPHQVPVRENLHWDASVDDAGRVLLAYSDKAGVQAIRRTPAGMWSRRKILGRPGHVLFRVARGPNGVAVVVHGPVDGDLQATNHINTSRMHPDGTWQPSQTQPHYLGLDGVAINRHGRTLLAGWDRHTFWGRWSYADGTWSKPFPIATGVSTGHAWGLRPRIALNHRGDAVATWATKSTSMTDRRTPLAWARFKPASGTWTRPMRLTPRNDRPQLLLSAIGDCGHAAFAWTTPGKPRKLHIRRATPAR